MKIETPISNPSTVASLSLSLVSDVFIISGGILKFGGQPRSLKREGERESSFWLGGSQF